MGLKNNKVYFYAVIAAVFAIVSTARAEEPNGSIEAQKTGMSEFMSHLHASYFASLHGPSLNNLESPYTVDATGKPSKQQMYLDSEINAPYRFNESVSVSPVIPFFLYTTMGQGASLGDLGFKVTERNTLTTNDFNLGTNLIFQLPTSDGSKLRGMDFAVKTTPSIRYIVHNTRLAFGAWTEAKAYLGVTSGKTFKLYGQPYVNYQLSRKFSLNMGYEAETDHMKGQKNNLDFKSYQADLMPGFIYMIAPTVMINPYLQIFTANNITSDRMALGAVVSASL